MVFSLDCGRRAYYCNLFVQALLELGADPRLIADDGATPEQVIYMYMNLLNRFYKGLLYIL